MPVVEDMSIRVSKGLTGEEVCSLTVPGDWDISDLKWEIYQKSSVPELQQRLVCAGRVLMNHELLSKVLTGKGVLEVILMRLDPEWAKTLQDVASGSISLLNVEEGSRHDRDLIMAAVRRNGTQLEFAPEELRADRDVVHTAVKERGRSLEFAAASLRGDQEIVLEAVRHDGLAVRHATEAARDDNTIGLAAVSQNGWALELLSDRLRGNREVVTKAIEQEGQAIKFVADELRDDRELVLTAVRSNAEALRVISPQFRKDVAIVRAASLGVRMRGFGGLNYFKTLLGSDAATLDFSNA